MGAWIINNEGQFKRLATFNFLGKNKMKNLLNYQIEKQDNKQSAHPTENPEFPTQ